MRWINYCKKLIRVNQDISTINRGEIEALGRD
jgi:hypothetical protein